MSASTPAASTSASRSPPENHDGAPALADGSQRSLRVRRTRVAPVLPADAARAARRCSLAPVPQGSGRARPPTLPDAARPPVAIWLAFVSRGGGRRGGRGKGGARRGRAARTTARAAAGAAPGPFSSVRADDRLSARSGAAVAAEQRPARERARGPARQIAPARLSAISRMMRWRSHASQPWGSFRLERPSVALLASLPAASPRHPFAATDQGPCRHSVETGDRSDFTTQTSEAYRAMSSGRTVLSGP